MVLGQQALCLLAEMALCEDEQDTMASLSGAAELCTEAGSRCCDCAMGRQAEAHLHNYLRKGESGAGILTP